jgi:hypothetical protein
MKTSLLATLVLCAAGLPAQDPEFASPVTTTLTKVRQDPDAFRNVKVKFIAQFASLGRISNPFFTQFTPSEYSNLYVWADEQPNWQRAAYDDLFGNLFYPKTGSQLEDIFELRMYERLEITAIVRNTFQDAPWIEVVDFGTISGQVDAAVLAHMYRGEQFMAERRWQRAIAELTLAPGAEVPPEVQRAAYKNLGICYLRIGESDQAMGCLRQAASYSTTFDPEIESLLATAETKPSLELDRVVGQQGLKDFERPMWEAFENDGQTRKARTMQ